jgi:hypothetical protein
VRGAGDEGLGDGQRDRQAREHPQDEEEQLAQLEPPRHPAVGAEEKIHGGELAHRSAPPADEVDDDGHGGAERADEHERGEEIH